jgi:serine/threonine-protein kinase ATR
MGQAGFISLTLTHTLPQLFAQCERKVLARISQELEKRPYTLFVDHSHEIFAYVYLLPTEQQIDQGLKFILETLVADAGDPAKLQLDSLLRSCIVNLLTELVSALGEESVQRREAVSISRRLFLQHISTTRRKGNSRIRKDCRNSPRKTRKERIASYRAFS